MTRYKLIKRIGLAEILLAALLQGLSVSAASHYPNKPVRLIVPMPPGGGSDNVARIIAQRMTESWKEQVVIDNRSGAGGTIGTTVAAKAPSDGYTLLFGAQTTLAINPALYKNLPFDPIRDFAPVTLVAYSPQLLAVHPSVQAKGLQEFVALAKAAPRQLSYASNGVGTSAHLSFEMFSREAGIQLIHVPYKGTGPALTDLIGGQVQTIIGSTSAILPHMKSGRARAIAVMTANRSVAMPQVPTMAESGLPGFEVKPWFGLLYPAGTPKTVVDKLYSDLRKLLATPDLRQKIAEQGAEVAFSESPRQFAAYIAAEKTLWAKVVAEVMAGSDSTAR